MQEGIVIVTLPPTPLRRRHIVIEEDLPQIHIPGGSLTTSEVDVAHAFNLSPARHSITHRPTSSSSHRRGVMMDGADADVFPPFVSDTTYTTPKPRTPFENTLYRLAEIGEVASALTHLSSKPTGRKVSAGALDLFITCNVSLAAFEQLLRWNGWSFAYCGPVRTAVVCGRIDLLPLLLSDARLDPNIGQPLRVAVERDYVEAFDLLLKYPRVSPNRGYPLFHAAMANKVGYVRKLAQYVSNHQAGRPLSPIDDTPYATPAAGMSAHSPPTGPSVAVSSAPQPVVVAMNRLANRYAMTPLIVSIHNNATDAFFALLNDRRVNINRGYCYTPLQVAVQKQRALFVRALLARDELEPDKLLGGDVESALWLALPGRQDILHMLLRDNRVAIPPDLIEALETEDDLASLDLLASARPRLGSPVGTLWTWRTVAVVIYAVLVFLCAVTDGVRFLIWTVQGADSTRSLFTDGSAKSLRLKLALYLIGALVTSVLHYRWGYRVGRGFHRPPHTPLVPETTPILVDMPTTGGAGSNVDLEQMGVDNDSLWRMQVGVSFTGPPRNSESISPPTTVSGSSSFPPPQQFRVRPLRRGGLWIPSSLKRLLLGNGEGFGALSLLLRVMLLVVPVMPVGEVAGAMWVFSSLVTSRLNVTTRDFHYRVVMHCAAAKGVFVFLPLTLLSLLQLLHALLADPNQPRQSAPTHGSTRRQQSEVLDVFQNSLLLCLYLATTICALGVWMARPSSKLQQSAEHQALLSNDPTE